MLEMTMGSRNTVPLRMLRIVPLGLFHIWGSGGVRDRGGQAAPAMLGGGKGAPAHRQLSNAVAIAGVGSCPAPGPRFPPPPQRAHLLEAKLLDARLVGRDGRALDAHADLLQGWGAAARA
jgi:hypothetical protein